MATECARPTLLQLASDLEAGRTCAVALAEQCLDRIAEDAGQGRASFIHVDAQGALMAADASDRLRRAGAHPSRLAGIPVSVKDLFDIRGQVTRAGSRVLDEGVASEDATAVARLRAAGLIIIGRTGMTEFAYSGLGLNPHYGTPLSPWRREESRISGGSTSGGAVSVADGMAHATLGSDTGGSCRIPAAWCGLVGFKPTASRIPRDGAVPLSTTLDTVGTIARSAECCALLDDLLTARAPLPLAGREIDGLRIGVVDNIVFDDCDAEVAAAFERALRRIEAAGASLRRLVVPAFDRVAQLNAKGGFTAAEAFAWHRERLATRGDEYDPRVAVRIWRGEQQDAADYVALVAARQALVAEAADMLAPFDAIAMPTTPILPPRLADLEDDADYGRINLLALRNPTLINMIDGCAVSLPATPPGDGPVGLMLASVGGRDRELLSIAKAVAGTLPS